MAVPIEVLFDRHVRGKYPLGWADLTAPHVLERHHLTTSQVAVMNLVRDGMNGALTNAKLVPDHVVNGPYHFDYIDADQQDACAFTGNGYSFLGLTIGMARWVLVRKSACVHRVEYGISLD